MLNTDISKELKCSIETNQNQLKNAIRHHQLLIKELRNCIDPSLTKELQGNIEEAQQQIIIIGLEQKSLVDKLRKEFRNHQKNVKVAAVKNGIEERRFNLSSALNRARKQNIVIQNTQDYLHSRITRATSVQSSSPSEESEPVSAPPTPEPITPNPINPQDVTQNEFLTYFGLATHDLYKEIQNKRAERKRRRTANPQFLYTKGWDISKRKRNLYLASNVSPPHTRQSVKNKHRTTSPSFKTSRPNSPIEKKVVPFQAISSFPSGLTIEKIHQSRVNADNTICIECREVGTEVLTCEVCTNGFHVSCHNRPLVQQPKHCPRCYKDYNLSSTTTDFTQITDLIIKLKKRDDLLSKNRELLAELTQLQDRHSQLTIAVKNQDNSKGELQDVGKITENKVQKVLEFVASIKEDEVAAPPSPVVEEEGSVESS